jgi:hypothetical protein
VEEIKGFYGNLIAYIVVNIGPWQLIY